MTVIDAGAGDGQWLLSDLEVTQIVPLECYENRQGDLAVTVTVSLFFPCSLKTASEPVNSSEVAGAARNDCKTSEKVYSLQFQFVKKQVLPFKT